MTLHSRKQLVVLDSQPGPEYDNVGAPLFSHEGRCLMYVAKNGQKQFVVIDGKAGPEFDGIGTPFFSPDGKRMAYVAQSGQKQLLVIDGQFGPEYDSIVLFAPAKLAFAGDGTLAYLAVKNGTLYRVWH